MKLLRPIAIAVLLVGVFFYFTTYRSGTFRLVNSPGGKVEITEAAGNQPLDQRRAEQHLCLSQEHWIGRERHLESCRL